MQVMSTVTEGSDTPESSVDHGAAPEPKAVGRWVLAAVGVGFLALTFAQASGSIEDDTRLPMLMSPINYIGSTLHLWNQNVYGGSVQLDIGFDLPTGLFFAITHTLHIPTWCAERVWLALLLTTGCWGVVRLSEALGIGNRWARVMAGLAYCASPIVLTWVTTSVDLLAVVLLPWVVLPLVKGSREGSPRRAAARSGIAVALMGGANPTVVVAALPLAVIWLATRRPGPRRRSLIGWWVIAVGMACFWWIAAAILVGKYGFNYLPYTETSTVTTSTTSAFEALRGASYWIDYFDLGGPLLPGAWTFVSSAIVILGTTVVTALGLAGLCRKIPERLFLVASLSFGVVVIAAGYAGDFGGLFSHQLQGLLQRDLEVFRSVSKFSPCVALPLALGLAWMLSVPLWGAFVRRITEKRPRANGLLVLAVSVVGIAAVAIAATPYWQQKAYPAGGFASIPQYWSQVGSWLENHQGHANALLVPGSDFADYTWGDPIDVPLQVVDDTSVEWRNIIPIASNGYIQMLDTVEQVLDGATSTPGLAQYLSRGGIKYVVVQNDLNLKATGAPAPAQVHEVLSETPGLKQVASFGPILPSKQATFGSLSALYRTQDLHLPSVEIFRVEAPTSVVRTYPAVNPVVVSGDVGSLLPLSGAGVVTDRAAVLAGDAQARGTTVAPQALWAITDGNQRRSVSFGAIRNNTSYVLGSGQDLPGTPSGVPLSYSVVAGSQHETVESPIDASSVSASSYGPSLLSDDPNEGPAAAFDGNPYTAWVANSANHSIGQWISITFDHPLDLSTITVQPLVGSPQQPSISRVTISTDRGSVVRRLPLTHAAVRLTIRKGTSRHLKITIDAVRKVPRLPSDEFALGAGFSSISIPGVHFQERLKVPDDESTAFSGKNRNSPVVVFTRHLEGVNSLFNETQTDDPNMTRSFALPKATTAHISGYALPVAGRGLQNLLNVLTPAADLTVTASSWFGDLPSLRPQNVVANEGAPWIANLGDKKPTLSLKWKRSRAISSISIHLTSKASRPTEIALVTSAGTRRLKVPAKGGRMNFAPLITNSLQIEFIGIDPKREPSPLSGDEFSMPVGIASLSIAGLTGVTVPSLHPDQSFALPCGQGPSIEIDGASIPTSVTGTVGDLLHLRPVHIAACPIFGVVQLAAGTHQFNAVDLVHPFEVTSIAVKASASSGAQSVATPRKTKIGQWSAEYRTLRVSAGPATYLAISQNYDTGWTATLGTKALKSVRLDGWEQGFLIPAGKAGVIRLVMSPDRLYRLFLLIGAALLAGLLALGLAPSRKRGAGSSGPRPSPPALMVFTVGLVALALISGPLTFVILPVALLARWRGRGAMAVVAFSAFIVAGAAAALHPASFGSQGAGALGGPAQVASVVAIAAVICALALDSRGENGKNPMLRKKKKQAQEVGGIGAPD